MFLTAEQEARISAVAEKCIELATKSATPYTEIGECIEELKRAPDWTEGEIIEVQTRVIRAILKQQHPDL
jgi:hypothetical protein